MAKRFLLPEVREDFMNVPPVLEDFLFVKVYYLEKKENQIHFTGKLLEFGEKLKERKSKVLVGWKKGTFYAKSE
jgi:hypothetical protein